MFANAAQHGRVERRILGLQSAIALLFCGAVLFGIFDVETQVGYAFVAWILGYHVAHAWYVLDRRIPGRPIYWVEVLTPLADATCITAGFIALHDPGSPLWALYLYLLVGHARRFHGPLYIVIAGWTMLNVAVSHLVVDPKIDVHFVTMLLLTVVMAALAHITGSAWRRVERQSRLLAEADPLTGIANRRTFYQRLEELAAEDAQPFAILMLDLDDFKRLNDEQGHQRGDEVLVQVAGVLRSQLRAEDIFGRYGGEEFIVAMPGASIEEAQSVAERLRDAISCSTPTSTSIGCAVRAFGELPDDVIRRADGLLLQAKRSGKNTVWISPRAAA